jgi:hypothetical protein
MSKASVEHDVKAHPITMMEIYWLEGDTPFRPQKSAVQPYEYGKTGINPSQLYNGEQTNSSAMETLAPFDRQLHGQTKQHG